MQKTFTERQKRSLDPAHWTLQLAVVPDAPFVIDSWCADESTHVGRQSNETTETFKAGMRGRINRLISSCKCVVVRLTAAYFDAHGLQYDPKKDLAGWCCYSFDKPTATPIIHFVYVKAEFRNQGLAGALMSAAGVRPGRPAWCTHDRLRLGKAMKARDILYNKYLLDYDPATSTAPNPRVLRA